MMDLRVQHLYLVDKVNDAPDEVSRMRAEIRLQGFREGVMAAGGKWSGVDADLHTMSRFGKGAPMCCGVLMKGVEK